MAEIMLKAMNHQLSEIQLSSGAVFAADSSIPVSFGNDAAALQAVQQGGAICDRSHWGRLQLTGADRKTFLHNQSTNNIQSLQPGQGCDTVFVTSTARTIDLASVYVLEEAVMVVVSPNRRDYLMKWLDRYIFFGDKVELQDVTEQTAMFSLVGPECRSLLQQFGVETDNTADASHRTVELAGQVVRLAVGSGLATAGYTLIMDAANAASVWEALLAKGAIPMGDRIWEHCRIQQGRPMPDQELTEDYNAVEACLWQAISINKGCYIGQETIARLDTYKGVKQQIWGIHLADAIAEPGTPLTVNAEKVGVLTSVTQTADGYFGLGYVRTKAGGAGLTVQVDGQPGYLVEVPFLRRDRETSDRGNA
ncbi:MAG: folate-binding protein [Leptolyngbyaceae cyanobacterium bins.349]|nr:folate-binding protein [Leptolyngbyaceae cyanobacterium bins.349]